MEVTDLTSLSRRELQDVAKQHGVRANQKVCHPFAPFFFSALKESGNDIVYLIELNNITDDSFDRHLDPINRKQKLGELSPQ